MPADDPMCLGPHAPRGNIVSALNERTGRGDCEEVGNGGEGSTVHVVVG